MTISFDTEVSRAPNYPSRRHSARERKVLETVQEKLTSDLLQHSFVQCEIDFATAGNRTVADHTLTVALPAGALVVRTLRKVSITNLDSTSNTGTIQLFLGASSGAKTLDSAAMTADGNTTAESVWTETTSVQTSDTAAYLTVEIATNAITSISGKVQWIVEYIIPV